MMAKLPPPRKLQPTHDLMAAITAYQAPRTINTS